jgi:hypothetical protein
MRWVGQVLLVRIGATACLVRSVASAHARRGDESARESGGIYYGRKVEKHCHHTDTGTPQGRHACFFPVFPPSSRTHACCGGLAAGGESRSLDSSCRRQACFPSLAGNLVSPATDPRAVFSHAVCVDDGDGHTVTTGSGMDRIGSLDTELLSFAALHLA